jgi:predicted PurR-regulated permease PerM
LTLIAIVVAVAALHIAKEILLPLALAILLSFLLTPLANRLERWGFGRILSVICVVGVTFVVLGLLAWVVTAQLVDLGRQLPTYRAQLVEKVRQLRPESSLLKDVSKTIEEVQEAATEELPDDQGEQADRDDDSDDKTASEASAKGPAAAEGVTVDGSEALGRPKSTWESLVRGFRWPDAEAPQEPVDVRVVGTPPSPLEQIRDWLGPLVAPLTTAGIAIVLVIFILLSREDQRNRLLQLFGSTHLHATTEALTDVTERVSRYLRMQFLINAGYGLAVGLGLWVIGVPSAVTWGVLSFSLRFLPYIGPWLSAVMPLLVSVASSEGWTQPIIVIAWFTTLELIVNNVAEPLLYGRSTGVSGVGVIVAAVFWTWVWGAVGLMLAMPLTVCIVVMARYIPGLHFLTVLLGDQPAMSLEERVYQRLLAGDIEESRELCAEFLEEASLVDLYDRVLIPALALAEQDRHGGLLHEDQQEVVQETAEELFDELSAAGDSERLPDDEAAAPIDHGVERTPARVLCIPLRDKADEISGRMLEHLLELEGFEVDMAASEALTGELVASIESLKVDVVVISILPPLPPRNSRLLCRRLRDRYPQLPIIVGYWCGDCGHALQRRLCAEDGETATTLAEAIDRVKAGQTRAQITAKAL